MSDDDKNLTAQILDITPDEYHRRPGLSASLAHTIVTQSPAHAQHQQRQMQSGAIESPTRAQDLGSVCHALTLGKGRHYVSLPFDNYKTKAAQDSRKAAREEGLVPLLWHEHDNALQIAERTRDALKERGFELDGASEVVIEYEEESTLGPVTCRSMLDHVWVGRGQRLRGVILDLKFVANATTDAVTRSGERFGYAIQETAYTRAVELLDPELVGKVAFIFAFCETAPPYAINMPPSDGMFREVGSRRWRRAVETWARCLAEHGGAPWPAFPPGQLTAPRWALYDEDML